MRNGSIEQQSVAHTLSHVAGASDILWRSGIDPTSRVSLRQAALAASVAPDELMAVLEYRARKAAKRQPTAQHEHEFELA